MHQPELVVQESGLSCLGIGYGGWAAAESIFPCFFLFLVLF